MVSVAPGVCRTSNERPSRGSGPGVGDHSAPDSSSRRNSASAVGSITGSLANGVSRCSRLLAAHVWAAPPLVTMVPKRSLAITLTHGSGVSSSPCRVTTYSRPPWAKPPIPVGRSSVGGGSGSVGAIASARGSRATKGSRLAPGGDGPMRSTWSLRTPRSLCMTTRATASSSAQSASVR